MFFNQPPKTSFSSIDFMCMIVLAEFPHSDAWSAWLIFFFHSCQDMDFNNYYLIVFTFNRSSSIKWTDQKDVLRHFLLSL